LWGQMISDVKDAQRQARRQLAKGIAVPKPKTAPLGWLAVLSDENEKRIVIRGDTERDFGQVNEECHETAFGKQVQHGYFLAAENAGADNYALQPVYLD